MDNPDSIRIATLADLPFLVQLEKTCFVISRQFSLASIKRSIISTHQDVYVVTSDGLDCGSATIIRYKKAWRLYSIAVLPEFRKKAIGRLLLRNIIEEARRHDIHQMVLEADAKQTRLLTWYESFGFHSVEDLKNYYGPGEHGKKMVLVLNEGTSEKRYFANVVVVDHPTPWLQKLGIIETVTPDRFLNDEKYRTAKELRIFNLCSSYDYQSIGYYVSLLASARNLRAIPNVATIEDFTDETITGSIGDEVEDLIQASFKHIKSVKPVVMRIVFGRTTPYRYVKLGKALSRLFEAPLLECTFEKNRRWHLAKVAPLPFDQLIINEKIERDADRYFHQRRFAISPIKQYKYDLAILVEPGEYAAPSGKTALDRFVAAAEKIGFYTEFITKEDFHRIPQFDALFIRATTNVNNYTYQFSRYAYSEGLVVIDDPWSILRCANKLYFHESMRMKGIPTPETVIVSRATPISAILSRIAFPVILKQPDSACSMGVFKVNDEATLKSKLAELFKTGELIIAQEFVQSAFDWRIGILDNKPLYACKYYMARNHWQIYHWNKNTDRATVGGVETFLVQDAPKAVVETAVKAAAAMGDGFYGVDIKEANGKVYVIEVNDNPSVDHHWEDRILGEKLYLQIMENFMARIEAARNVKRKETKK